MKRNVTYTEEYGGIFHIDCAECPLIPAFQSLDKKQEACISGVVTNIQGQIPIHQCKHYAKDSISNENHSLWLECRKEDV